MIIAYSREWQYKDIGDRKQFFVDDDVVACVRNVKRTYHSPKKHPANPLIQRDQPWEVLIYPRANSFNVIYDPAERLFKCWYEDQFEFFGVDNERAELCRSRIYYAESEDGLHWRKPGMGKLFLDGRNTNTVFSYPPYEIAAELSVLLDEHDPDPARRYKAVYVLRSPNANRPKRSTMPAPHCAGVSLAFSPNGIDWTPFEGNPIVTHWGGDAQILTYDPIDRKYVLNGRADMKWATSHPESDPWFFPVYPGNVPGIWGTRRCQYRHESEDCIHWTKGELMLEPGPDDNLQDAYYDFIPWRAGELHLGILNVFHEVDNTLDMELLYSRDGKAWQHLPGRRPLIARGPEGSYDSYMLETTNPPVVVGDELWIYYGGGSVHHDWWIFGQAQRLDVPEAKDPRFAYDGFHICLATLRLDGWVSLDATIREGYIETKPVFSAGKHLFINGRCAAGGTIQVEVMDNWNHVWPGYGKADCQTFTGDSVHHKVAWTGGDAVNMIPGIVKLRFHLRDAELYSFQIADS
jgi:hypothetical protein